MIHSQYFQRKAQAGDPALSPTGCQKIPKCYCLRIQPALTSSGPVAGLAQGAYPLTIHRGGANDRIEVMDSQVLYFAKGLLPPRGGSLVGWVATLPLGSAPDTWLMTWGDEPGDYIDPTGDRVVTGPTGSGYQLNGGVGEFAPVLVGGRFNNMAGGEYASALEMLGYFGASRAARVARKGEVLFDSGLIAAGAVITTPAAMDFRGCDALEILADNSAGAVFRDLTMDVCDEAGVTLETILLRKVAWGAAANGSQYAPGKVRGLISESPPGGKSGSFVLYDVTGVAGGVVDTGPLVTEDLDGVTVTLVSTGAAAPSSVLSQVDDAGAFVALNPNATSAVAGPGVAGVASWSLGAGGNILAGVPRRIRHGASGGVGSTVRVLVVGRGRPPGTFAVQMAVPPRARFTLAAGGAGNGRLIIIGR